MARWLAPILGLSVAFVLAIKQISGEDKQDFTYVVIFAGLGLLAGLIILVADQTESQREEQLAKSPGSSPEFRTIARSLSIIALIISILPIVGLAVSLIALVANIRHRGWPRIISAVAAMIGTERIVTIFWLQ